MLRHLAFAGLLLALSCEQASAQQPTQAQRDAIRAACRSDFIANCSGVQPGGREAFECLLQNDAKLSPSCQAAVNAAAPKAAEPAAPAAPADAAPAQSETAPPAAKVERAPPGIQVAPAEAPNEQVKTVQQACTLNDFVSHCSWIAPNNPEILQCLKANAADLSPNCQAAVRALPAAPPTAAAPAPAPAKKPVEPKPVEPKPPEPPRASSQPAPAAPAAAAPAKPTAQQTAAIRAACRSDFMSRCSGVQPGGAEALQCLKRNEAQLSAACRGAVAAIGGGTSAAIPSGAPAATPAVAPLGPMPMLRPREALAIVQICGVEVRSLCAGVPFGGGRIISCLAANASSLSPGCYSALSAAAGR
jgi:outer membrane biosynthesis protein TonB